jgi:hypothetical protein
MMIGHWSSRRGRGREQRAARNGDGLDAYAPKDAVQKDNLTFHIAPLGSDRLSFEESDAFSRTFIHSLGLRVQSGCWSDIDLDSPAIDDFMDRAAALITERKAEFFGYNLLRQTLLSSPEAPLSWYRLRPQVFLYTDSLDGGVEAFKAYTTRPDIHIAMGPTNSQALYVSESFKTVVEECALTGIDFVWVKDTGKYRARQWFIPVALEPMGRGIDHPWFDPRKLKGSDSWQPRSAEYRTGVWRFDIHQLRRGLSFANPIHRRLLDVYSASRRPSELYIDSFLRFLGEHAPLTDFAYVWREEDKDRGGSPLRARDLCLSARARQVLLDHRVVTENDLEGVALLDEAPPGCRKLDGIAPLPKPVHTPEEIHDIRRRLEPAWQGHLAVQKPTRAVKLADALALLRREKKKRPDDFRPGLGRSKRASLGPFLPADWLEVLGVCNGGLLNDRCQVAPLEELPDLDEEKRGLVASNFDDYPYDSPHVPVAAADNGDWFSLAFREDEADAGCRVVRVSHEDLSILFTWDSIAVFVHDMLAGFYD